MVQCVSLWSEQQQQVLLTLVMVIRTKQIIGLKLGSCFLLLPASPLITSLLSWDQHHHTHRNKHTHLQIPSLSVTELQCQLTHFVVLFIVTEVIQREQR